MFSPRFLFLVTVIGNVAVSTLTLLMLMKRRRERKIG